MGNINSVELSGHLTRDAELKVTKSGYPVVTFGMAVNERRKNSQTGVYDSIPNFFECVVHGKYGEAMCPPPYQGVFPRGQGQAALLRVGEPGAAQEQG